MKEMKTSVLRVVVFKSELGLTKTSEIESNCLEREFHMFWPTVSVVQCTMTGACWKEEKEKSQNEAYTYRNVTMFHWCVYKHICKTPEIGSFAEMHTDSWGGPHHFDADAVNKSSEDFRPKQFLLPFEI